MNPEASPYTCASNEPSSVRPRNRRLISYSEEDDSTLENAGVSTSRSRSRQSSPFPCSGVSSIPGAHPSRPPSTKANAGPVATVGYGARRDDRGQVNPSPGLGLWESWSSLQGIASTLLGSDAQQAKKGKIRAAFNNSLSKKPGLTSGPWHPGLQWGRPTGLGEDLIPGTKEERQALVQAKRREALLLADVDGCRDSSSLYKRRDSDPRLSYPAMHAEQDGDALVYVHKVKPQDTLAGVMIRYQCEPAIFRKVNRLWPNDNIQIRQRVFLPVEACAVRGRKIDGVAPIAHESHISSAMEKSKPQTSNYDDPRKDNIPPETPLNTNSDIDPGYKHEWFVCIPGIAENVEVARIPRRTLGYFPPPRRKSQTFSDTAISSSGSAKTSLDLSSHLQSLSLNTSPSRNGPKRLRRSGSGSCFADRLKGPGGVGTLRGSGPGGAVNPGPAEDSLNKMFAHHLPNLAPRESFDSVRSTSSSTATGLENVGGLIEGWVRKVGTKLAGSIDPSEAYRQQSRMADLIELESSGDAPDDGDDDDERGDGGGPGAQQPKDVAAAFDDVPSTARRSRDHLGGRGGNTAVITATEEALLRQRFPPKCRGRVVDAHHHTDQRR